MATENRLIRHIEGTIASPASATQKQISVNVGVEGTRDRTKLIYTDSDLTTHEYITMQQVEDMIEAGIPVTNGVYVVPATPAEFVELLQSALILNIWVENIDLTSLSFGINIISSKNIYAPDNTRLIFADCNISWIWPSSGSTPINISFYTDINDSTSNQFHQIGFAGSPDYRIRFKAMRFLVTDLTSSANIGTIFESNKSTTTTIESATQFLELWSGDNTFGLQNSSTAVIKTDPSVNTQTLKLGDESGNTLNLSTDVSAGTTGVVVQKLVAMHGLNVQGRLGFKTPQGVPEILSAWQMQIGGNDVWNIDEQGHMGINTLPYEWGEDYSSTDEGTTGTSATHTDGTKIVGNNIYHDGTNLRFKVGSVEANWTETLADGTVITYTNSNTPSALDPITEVELERVDREGNKSYDGATIPATLSSGYGYEFWPSSCVMRLKGLGDIISGNNLYWDGTVFKSMITTGAKSSYTRLNSSVFEIRQSTLNATSIGQTMIMTTVITPT